MNDNSEYRNFDNLLKTRNQVDQKHELDLKAYEHIIANLFNPGFHYNSSEEKSLKK